MSELQIPQSPLQLDSLDIGTPSKGGNIKIYFNAGDHPDTNNRKADEALRLRKYVQEKMSEVN